MAIDRVSLFNTSGSSNKEYHVELVAGGDGYLVNTRHGPRGRATVLGAKTAHPVDLAKARKIFDKLVAEKIAGGYTRDESGVAYTDTEDAGRRSGWQPALLESAAAEDLASLVDSPHWLATEKIDGERRAVEVQSGGLVVGINRRGLYVPVPQTWERVFGQLPAGTLLDGEHLGETLHVFDCVRLGDQDLRQQGYAARWDAARSALTDVMMRELRRGAPPEVVNAAVLLHVFGEAGAKRDLLRAVERRGGEGVVFRHRDSVYVAGRDTGSLKHKFVESASCIVARVNEGRRSVGLALLDEHGAAVDVGNVTVPANHPVPEPGCVVEVRYMHMFEGGSLYQPVYSGARSDVVAGDCLLSQVTRVRRKEIAGDEQCDVGEEPGVVDGGLRMRGA
jgi:bifunctional non-homologous end joining protein LigD